MPPIKAILFDLDGTLLDTLADLADAMNQALTHFGFPQRPLETYKTAVGDGIHLLAERVLPADSRTAETITRLVAQMQTIYAQNWMNKTRPYTGIYALLKALQARNIRMAVLSNKPDARTRMCVDHYFSPCPFDVVMGASDPFPLKPDPAAAHHIMATMQIPPAYWLYIGDTNTDMQTAKRAGLTAVGVTWGFRDRQELLEHGADHIIDAPHQLLRLDILPCSDSMQLCTNFC